VSADPVISWLRELAGGIGDHLGALAVRVASRLTGRVYIGLNYPPAAAAVPRYGYGRPSHTGLRELLARHDDEYRKTLDMIGSYRSELQAIRRHSDDPAQPSWMNAYLPGLDGAAIYAFLRSRRPATYLEIGSGNSTKFAARARDDGRLDTKIVSVDPSPRAEVDALCDEVIRSPFELADLSVLDRLRPGDVVFFDGSHRVFMNSDVAAFFLDVLPRLPPGVLIGIHDIYLPDDYEPAVAERYYSEQYMLAAYLLGGGEHVTPVLPAMYLSRATQFDADLDKLWAAPEFIGVERHGGAFWFSLNP
jgi:predicted O-methyltransferase YrrM